MSKLPSELRFRCFTAFGSKITFRLSLSWPYWLCGDDKGSTIFQLDEDLTEYDHDSGVLLDSLRLGLHDMKSRWEQVKVEQQLSGGCYTLPDGFHRLFVILQEIETAYELSDALDLSGAAVPYHYEAVVEPAERRVLVDLLFAMHVLTRRAVAQTKKSEG